MKQILYRYIRIITGIVFIFSGFVKMVDPVGTEIKLHEYFSPEVLNLPFLNPYALGIGMLFILLEWAIGWALIFNFKPKLTLNIALILMTFFLFLTGYSAITHTVTDCGCFGDAVKLTPRQTFEKNIVLMLLLIYLRFNIYDSGKNLKLKTTIVSLLSIGALVLMLWTIRHLPLIDFRPYAVGKNIREGMSIPPDAPKAKFVNHWYYRIDGKVKEFSDKDQPWNIPGAEFVKRETEQISEGYIPPIHDFSIEGDWGDITDKVLDAPEIYIIAIPYPQKLTGKDLKQIVKIIGFLKKNKKDFVITTAEITPALERLTRTVDTPLNITDSTTLKTMIRSRAGILLLKKASVAGKWALYDFPVKQP